MKQARFLAGLNFKIRSSIELGHSFGLFSIETHSISEI